MTELGAETDPARTADRKSSSRSEELEIPSRFRRGFDGEPSMVSSPIAANLDSFEEDDDSVPNLNPPESLRPCFLDRLPSFFRVDVVVATKPLLSEPELTRLGEVGPVISLLKPFHPSTSQLVLLLVLVGGSADTGRDFLRRLGVASSFSVSVSVSLLSPRPCRGAGKEFECGSSARRNELECGKGGVPPSPGMIPP